MNASSTGVSPLAVCFFKLPLLENVDCPPPRSLLMDSSFCASHVPLRSEERRVGKQSRSRTPARLSNTTLTSWRTEMSQNLIRHSTSAHPAVTPPSPACHNL